MWLWTYNGWTWVLTSQTTSEQVSKYSLVQVLWHHCACNWTACIKWCQRSNQFHCTMHQAVYFSAKAVWQKILDHQVQYLTYLDFLPLDQNNTKNGILHCAPNILNTGDHEASEHFQMWKINFIPCMFLRWIAHSTVYFVMSGKRKWNGVDSLGNRGVLRLDHRTVAQGTTCDTDTVWWSGGGTQQYRVTTAHYLHVAVDRTLAPFFPMVTNSFFKECRTGSGSSASFSFQVYLSFFFIFSFAFLFSFEIFFSVCLAVGEPCVQYAAGAELRFHGFGQGMSIKMLSFFFSFFFFF